MVKLGVVRLGLDLNLGTNAVKPISKLGNCSNFQILDLSDLRRVSEFPAWAIVAKGVCIQS